VLIPVVFISLVSGVVLALSTPWGLVRHWWVLAKCAIAVTLTATGLLLMLPRLDQVVAAEGEPVQMQTLLARSLALVLLLAATGISVIKPWGKTPHGRSVQAAGKRPVKRPDHLVQQK
jgi:MFS superfamily sulfate permease-like transporter